MIGYRGVVGPCGIECKKVKLMSYFVLRIRDEVANLAE
jgi:hypothetical protein